MVRPLTNKENNSASFVQPTFFVSYPSAMETCTTVAEINEFLEQFIDVNYKEDYRWKLTLSVIESVYEKVRKCNLNSPNLMQIY